MTGLIRRGVRGASQSGGFHRHARRMGFRVLMAALVAASVGLTAVGPISAAAPTPIYLLSAQCPSPIKYGDYNSGCVAELQRLLNELGYGLTVDGDFGPLTRTAVMAFQAAHPPLEVDGLVGPKTKPALYAAVAALHAPTPRPTAVPTAKPTATRPGASPRPTMVLPIVATPKPTATARRTSSLPFVQPSDSGYVAYLRALEVERAAQLVRAAQARREAFLQLALNEAALGVKENPGTSGYPSADKYFFGKLTKTPHWCAIFVSWVAEQTGTASHRGAYTPDWVRAATPDGPGKDALLPKKDPRLSITNSPQPGDLVLFDWVGQHDRIEHMGIIKTFSSAASFETVEGNTSDPNKVFGEGVYIKNRASQNSYTKRVVFIHITF
jgi:peptidoglycan hydrolase-like protein with peptidoglycan-binding domain